MLSLQPSYRPAESPLPPVPTVAAINGHCFAAGMMLALACDYRVMTDGSKRNAFLCMNEVRGLLAFEIDSYLLTIHSPVRFISARPGRCRLPLYYGQKFPTRICTGKLPLKVIGSRQRKHCRLALLIISSTETPKLSWRKLSRLQRLQAHLQERVYGASSR